MSANDPTRETEVGNRGEAEASGELGTASTRESDVGHVPALAVRLKARFEWRRTE